MKNKLVLGLILLFASNSMAAAGGGHSFGIQISQISAGQTDIDNLVKSARADNGADTSELGSITEISGQWAYRFSGSIVSFIARPGYFFTSSEGSNSSNEDYNYSLSGFSLFAISRFTALENNYFKFFLQSGIGWGFLSGEIEEADVSVDFSGNDVGFLGGLGAEFCFAGSNHCMSVEGNVRYMPIERSIADSASGSCDNNSNTGLSKCDKGREVEMSDHDLRASLSGITGTLGYSYYF